MNYRIAVAVFLVLVGFASVTSAQIGTGNTLELGVTNELIPTLVDPRGMTLYTFERDADGVSACYDRCAEAWPPYLLEEGTEAALGGGLTGEIGTVARDDGTTQITYQGEPLYFFFQDEVPGDANGHGAQSVWYAANPATVMMGGNQEIGNFLVGPGGKTLYIFLQDSEGESYCYDECTQAWPPLLVKDGEQPIAGVSVPGEVGAFQREDGGWQVTYNNIPLYFFIGDEQVGDANGEGAQEVWYATLPEGQTLPTGDE